MTDISALQKDAEKLLGLMSHQLDCDGDWRDEGEAICVLVDALQIAFTAGAIAARNQDINIIGQKWYVRDLNPLIRALPIPVYTGVKECKIL